MFSELLLNLTNNTVSQDVNLQSSAQKILSEGEELKLNLMKSMPYICEEIAIDLFKQKKYQEASKEFKKIYLITQEDHYKGLFLHAHAMFLQCIGKSDESIAKNFVALKLVKDGSFKGKIRYELIKSLRLEGIELAKQNYFEQAAISIGASMKLKFDSDAKLGIIHFLESLGRLAIAGGRFDIAIQKYIAAYQITNDPNYKANIVCCRGFEIIKKVPTTGLGWIALASTICASDYVDRKFFLECYKGALKALSIDQEIKIAEIMSIDREKVIQKSGKELYKFLDIDEINADEEILVFENVNFFRIQESLEQQHLSEITPLHTAAFWGQIDEVKKLLESEGVEINKQTIGGDTALHLSVISGHPEIVELFLKHPYTNIALTCDDGYTALELSIVNNRLEILELFARYGLDLKKQNYLELAFENKSHGTILFFYSLGLNLDLRGQGYQNISALLTEIEDLYNASPNIYKIIGGIRLLNDLEKLPLLPGVPFAIKFLLIELHETITEFLDNIHKDFATKSSIIRDLEKHHKGLPYLIEACKDLLTQYCDDGICFENVPCVGLVKYSDLPKTCKSSFKDDQDQKQLFKDITSLLDELTQPETQLLEDSLLSGILVGVSSIGISGGSHVDIE